MVAETPAGGGETDLDDEAKRLALEELKAKSRQAIAAAQAGMFSALVPAPEGAPTGQTALAEKAGAYGPWLVHLCVEAAAEKVAKETRSHLEGLSHPRVLVVENRAFLASDYASREINDALTALTSRLTSLAQELDQEFGHHEREPETHEPGARRDVAMWNAPGLTVVEREGQTRSAPSGAGVGAASAIGALPAAVGLLNLLRTDYSVAPLDVTTTTAELAALTAAHLTSGNDGLRVLLDDFVTVDPESATLSALRAAVEARTRCAAKVRQLEAGLARLEAEAKIISARVALVQEAWKAAVAAKEGQESEGKERALAADLDKRTKELVRLDVEVAAMKALFSSASGEVAAAGEALDALVAAPTSGPVPILAAVARERLHSKSRDGEGPITHVLHVQLDGAGADSQTRRLVLGESGRVGFMGGVSCSWLLMEVETGYLMAGGLCPQAKMMVYDLETGDAKVKEVSADGTGPSGKDPALDYEKWAKLFIAVVSLFLIAVAAMGMVNLASGS